MVTQPKLNSFSLSNVKIQDAFWSDYMELVRDVVVPYQWEALNDRIENVEPSHAIKNFKIAAGEEQGEFHGTVFQDSDVAKWLEAVGYLLTNRRDTELERIADGVVDIIAKAQHENGYLNTYFTIKEPEKQWTNLCECHELYCAGHMIEGAIAYYNATKKRKILDVVIKFADHIYDVFGTETDKIQGYDGHQEIELALLKLYEVTSDEKYLRLSHFFLEERGNKPDFYDEEYEKRGKTTHFGKWMIENKSYSQAHQSIHEQEVATGHSVRFVYMCTAMAHFAKETGNTEMYESCKRLWGNLISRQMYITGGIGSQTHGEAFSIDYDLPNDTVYAETCASVGLIFFAHRMLQLEPDSQYADVMEKALYNTVLGSISRDGKSFFYVNPLEVYPNVIGKNQNYNHIKPIRQGWFGCGCCPPNVARLLASLGQYVYTIHENTAYVNLYISGQAELMKDFILKQKSNYPWNGDITFTVKTQKETDYTLALRIPNWCEEATVTINGEVQSLDDLVINGYALINRNWKNDDQINLTLPMPVTRVKGHPLVRQLAGKTAVQRGPLVYCLEEVDNGPDLHQIIIPDNVKFEVIGDPNLLGGIKVIMATARKWKVANWGDVLYKQNVKLETEAIAIKFIPYYAWANRGLGEMKVWVDEANKG